MIGIVGATGAVGRVAAAGLHRWGVTDLRLGGRNGEALRELAGRLPGTTASPVDLFDPAALAAFCAECTVVVNCAGPAFEIGARVARAAGAARAGYVDAAGDDLLLRQVKEGWRSGTALISAGMMPGLTALLPRVVARSVQHPHTLTGYVGGRDGFTVHAAADFLHSSSAFGSVGQALRAGRRTASGARPARQWLPFFPDQAEALGYLSTEIERVCAAARILTADWFSVFAGEHLAAAVRSGAGPEAIVRAAAMDSFGHKPYQLIVVEVAGADATSTAVLRGSGASALTGDFAALAAWSVLHGKAPSGVHHAGEVLEPLAALEKFRTAPSVDSFEVFDGAAAGAGMFVEETV